MRSNHDRPKEPVASSSADAPLMGGETTTDGAESGSHRVARGGLANLIGAGYAGIASFAITVLVTRIATPEDAGLYFSALSVLLIAVALAELGIPVGYVYFLARFRGLGQPNKIRPALLAGALPVLCVGVILVVAGVVFRDPISDALFGSDLTAGSATIIILSFALLVAIAADSSLGATRGLGVMRPTVTADKFINPTVQLLALLLLAALGWTGGEELVWTRVVGFIAAAAVGIAWLARLLRRHPSSRDQSLSERWRPGSQTFQEFWQFTAPRAVGQVAQVGIQRGDIVLVALLLGPADAAIYAAATRFLIFGQLAGQAIGTAVQPRISALSARGEFAALQDLYRVSTSWVMVATWPFYLTFLVQADWLMRVFGEEYASGAVVLQILSAVMLIATACGAVDAVLLMAGRSTLTMINSWVALILNVGLNIWLLPHIGIVGAAVAWAAAILATNLVPLVQVKVTLGVHPFGLITTLAAVAPITLFGLVPWLVSLWSNDLLVAIATFVLLSTVYALLLWRWRGALGLKSLLRRRPDRSADSLP